MNWIKARTFLFAWMLIVMSACTRKEPTSWDTDVRGPLVYGRLSLENVVTDSLLFAEESGLWHLRIDESLTDFELDSIVEIPDTVILKEYPLLISGSFFPGFALPISQGQQINIQHPTVQLKHARMKSGQLHYRLVSPVDGYLNCTLHIPGLSLNGAEQSIQINTTPPGAAESFVAEGFIDLTGADLDLTGESGSSFNRIAIAFDVVVDPNSSQPANVAVGDEITLELAFVEPKLAYARGYFGTHEYALDEQVDFSSFAAMPEGVLNLDGATMQFYIRNGVGIDAQIDFDEISNYNATNLTSVVLDHPSIYEPINITRAHDNVGSVQAYEYNFDVNASNSNLDAFLENLPTQFVLRGDVVINPLGNVSDGNDFIYTDDALDANFTIDVPMRFGMQNLHLTDTLFLTNEAEEIPLEGDLQLWVKNGFPVDARVSLYVLENGARVTVAENLRIESAVPTTTPSAPTPTESWLTVAVSEELFAKMHAANPLLIDVTLETPGAPSPVGIYSNQFIDFKLILDGTYTLQYGE
jgi:hypothetical protein